MNEVSGVAHRSLVSGRRLIRTLRAEVHVRAADAPELQAARPTDLVKLEVPFAARAIGALGQPAARRSDPEQAPVLLPAHRELESDAFVPAEERQVAVRRCGPHDLETAPILEPTKRSDQISLDSPE